MFIVVSLHGHPEPTYYLMLVVVTFAGTKNDIVYTLHVVVCRVIPQNRLTCQRRKRGRGGGEREGEEDKKDKEEEKEEGEGDEEEEKNKKKRRRQRRRKSRRKNKEDKEDEEGKEEETKEVFTRSVLSVTSPVNDVYLDSSSYHQLQLTGVKYRHDAHIQYLHRI